MADTSLPTLEATLRAIPSDEVSAPGIPMAVVLQEASDSSTYPTERSSLQPRFARRSCSPYTASCGSVGSFRPQRTGRT